MLLLSMLRLYKLLYYFLVKQIGSPFNCILYLQPNIKIPMFVSFHYKIYDIVDCKYFETKPNPSGKVCSGVL